MAKQEPSSSTKVLDVISRILDIGFTLFKFVVLFLFAGLLIVAVSSFAPNELAKGNVAVIPISGLISTSDGSAFSPGTNSQTIVDLIDEADKNSDIKAILFDIDSPGGTPVATDEISRAIKSSNKTTVALIRETGASGAFWVATSANHVVANAMSITGSIGVTASQLEFGGLLTEYNVSYQRLVAGKYKDIGTPYRSMSPEEQQLFQQLLDKLHTQFINAVAENRHLSPDYVRNLSTGMVYLGSDAKELGLVDQLGGKEALAYIESTLNITAEPVDYQQQSGLLQSLSGLSSQAFYRMGEGIGSTFSTDTKVSLT